MTISVKPAAEGVWLDVSSDDVVLAREYVPSIAISDLIHQLEEAEAQSFSRELAPLSEEDERDLAELLCWIEDHRDNDPAIESSFEAERGDGL